MRKFNARKTPREHRLFLTKHHKLGLTRHIPSFAYDSKVPNSCLVILVNKRLKKLEVENNYYSFVGFYDAIEKIGIKLSLTDMISNFELAHGAKIKELGLTRLDFSRYRNFNSQKEIDKIYKRKGLTLEEKQKKIRALQKRDKKLRGASQDKFAKCLEKHREEMAEQFAKLHTLCTDDLDDVPF